MGDRWCCLNLSDTPNETPIAVIFYSNNSACLSTDGSDGGLGESEGKCLFSNAASLKPDLDRLGLMADNTDGPVLLWW